MEPESLCFQGLASLYFASVAFFPASLGCDNGILWIITAVQSLINVCKTLRSSDEECCVHPVQHIISNKHRLFLILATTHSWWFSYHTTNHMRMAVMGHVKVQLSHYVDSRNSRCFKEENCEKDRCFIWQTLLASSNKCSKDFVILRLHPEPASEGNSCLCLFSQRLVSWRINLAYPSKNVLSLREPRGRK